MREEVNKLKERSEELKEQKRKEEEKIHDLFVLKEGGEEIKLLRAGMSLRRRSEEVVKMQDRL